MPGEVAPHVQQITGALRAMESLLLRGAEQTARRNAWSAVLEDRKRAKDRHEAQHVIDTLARSAPSCGRTGPENF